MEDAKIYQSAKIDLFVGCEKGKVVVDFGTNLSHLEVDPEVAEQIAAMLLHYARNARGIEKPILAGGEN